MTKLIKEFKTSAHSKLLLGNLYGVELEMQDLLKELGCVLMSAVLSEAGSSEEMKSRLMFLAGKKGLGKLRKREQSVRLSNGQQIKFDGYRAEQAIKSYQGTRNMNLLYWSCHKGASPLYISRVSLLSVLCPSFEVAEQVLTHFGVSGSDNLMRTLCGELGRRLQEGGPSVLLKTGESLAGKRVVIMQDGGRSRIRCYTGSCTKKGGAEFDTPWCEPRLIVVHVLNEAGEVDRKYHLPFYWADLQKADAHFANLKQVLQAMNIAQAKEVQFIADGATFMWKRIRQALIDCGVSPKITTLSLDYYHAAGHLHELVDKLPGKQAEKQTLLNQLKSHLWKGTIYSILSLVRKYLSQKGKNISKAVNTKLNYFKKHHDHMQYAKFKRKKLLCGSGMVESAIRRIINLRFKAASSFWIKENLELLIPLRCAFLAGRWDCLMRYVSAS